MSHGPGGPFTSCTLGTSDGALLQRGRLARPAPFSGLSPQQLELILGPRCQLSAWMPVMLGHVSEDQGLPVASYPASCDHGGCCPGEKASSPAKSRRWAQVLLPLARALAVPAPPTSPPRLRARGWGCTRSALGGMWESISSRLHLPQLTEVLTLTLRTGASEEHFYAAFRTT